MIAILSDIHANLEALQAVLEDISRFDVERIVCLGDTIGYGADPITCLDMVRRTCDLVLLGNHDQALFFDELEAWGRPAAQAIYWTRGCLERDGEESRWAFLQQCSPSHKEGPRLYVHGSAHNPLHGYLFPEDVYNQRKMERILALVPHICFCGHTHLPGVITDSGWHFDRKTHRREQVGESVYEWHQPEGDEWTFDLDSRLAIVNVGSVGQPRDADPRAGYVLAEGERLRFRRVTYDVEATIRKIHAVPELENFLGDRLREGR